MPFETGTTVRTSDGQDGGILGRKELIKAGELEDRTADGDAIRMRLSQAELAERPDYEEEETARP